MIVRSSLDRSVGVAIRKLREQRGWTMQQLAACAGVVDTTLRRVELGRTVPHRATVAAIAGALGLSVDDLVAAAVLGHAAVEAPRERATVPSPPDDRDVVVVEPMREHRGLPSPVLARPLRKQRKEMRRDPKHNPSTTD